MERRSWGVALMAAALLMGAVAPPGMGDGAAASGPRVERRRGLEAARAGRWVEARTALERSLRDEPANPEALFALGLCQGQTGDVTGALTSLRRALAAGYQDYDALRHDPGLAPVRAAAEFPDLVAEAEARQEAFDVGLAAACRETYAGGPFTVRRAASPRLVLVTDLEAPVADRLVAALAAAETSHRAALFPNGLRHAIVLYAPVAPGSTAGALFSPASRTLQLNAAAPVGTILREFARALHVDDQAAHGQVHAPWLAAGLVALYERALTPPEGARATRDWRLQPLRDSLEKPSFIPLPRLLRLTSAQFDSQAVAEARYLLLWLQETDRLPAFYRAYLAGWEDDPTGKAALLAVTGQPLATMEAAWRAYLQGNPVPDGVGD
jgi:hypothetical protein